MASSSKITQKRKKKSDIFAQKSCVYRFYRKTAVSTALSGALTYCEMGNFTNCSNIWNS